MDGCGYGHMGWMVLWWIFGIALVAVLVWALLRASVGGPSGVRDSPEQLLKRRYASGEIDRETYRRMLADLRGQGGRDDGSD